MQTRLCLPAGEGHCSQFANIIVLSNIVVLINSQGGGGEGQVFGWHYCWVSDNNLICVGSGLIFSGNLELFNR